MELQYGDHQYEESRNTLWVALCKDQKHYGQLYWRYWTVITVGFKCPSVYEDSSDRSKSTLYEIVLHFGRLASGIDWSSINYYWRMDIAERVH